MSYVTTSYGTWGSRVNTLSNGPDADVEDYVGSGDDEWRERVQSSGALDRMKQAYRDAIERVLPADVSLCGNEFTGPAQPEDGEFDGYPKTEHGSLDLKAMIEGIDFEGIIEKYDPDNEQET